MYGALPEPMSLKLPQNFMVAPFQTTARHANRRAATLLLILLLIITTTYRYGTLLPSGCNINDVHNSTLGFQDIFAISFPERTDKRDLLVLAASFVGFQFSWSPGVAFEDISPKAAPVNWNYEKRTPGSLGCWRAHMDVLQHIVTNRIQSALILEDDSDFDISLKQQLASFAAGTRALQSQSQSPSPSPYGPTWDFLWLGHCKLGPADTEKQLYIIEDDPTVMPLPRRHGLWAGDYVPPEVLANNTRIIFPAGQGGLCMYAYALTYSGARKALAALSVIPQDDVVDMSYRHLCSGRLGMPFACYGVYPTLFGSHRAAGPKSRDSDLNHKDSKWHDEYTFDVQYSVMQGIPALAAGSGEVKAQFPEVVERGAWGVGERIGGVGRLEGEVDLKKVGRRKLKGVNRND